MSNRLWPREWPTVGGKRKARWGKLYDYAWLWHVLLPATLSRQRGGLENGKAESEDDEVGNEKHSESSKSIKSEAAQAGGTRLHFLCSPRAPTAGAETAACIAQKTTLGVSKKSGSTKDLIPQRLEAGDVNRVEKESNGKGFHGGGSSKSGNS